MCPLPGMNSIQGGDGDEEEFLFAAKSLARTLLKKKGTLIDEAMEQVIQSRAEQLLKDWKESK